MDDLRRSDRCAGFGAGLARGFFFAGFFGLCLRAAGFFVFLAFAGFFGVFAWPCRPAGSAEKT